MSILASAILIWCRIWKNYRNWLFPSIYYYRTLWSIQRQNQWDRSTGFERFPRNPSDRSQNCTRSFEEIFEIAKKINMFFFTKSNVCLTPKKELYSVILASIADMSIECETLDLRELSNSILKMHVQKLSIIKWIFSSSQDKPQMTSEFDTNQK